FAGKDQKEKEKKQEKEQEEPEVETLEELIIKNINSFPEFIDSIPTKDDHQFLEKAINILGKMNSAIRQPSHVQLSPGAIKSLQRNVGRLITKTAREGRITDALFNL